jgi:hypothetical protein
MIAETCRALNLSKRVGVLWNAANPVNATQQVAVRYSITRRRVEISEIQGLVNTTSQ